MSKCVGVKRK